MKPDIVPRLDLSTIHKSKAVDSSESETECDNLKQSHQKDSAEASRPIDKECPKPTRY